MKQKTSVAPVRDVLAFVEGAPVGYAPVQRILSSHFDFTSGKGPERNCTSAILSASTPVLIG
jgi:hypothetical protein